MFDTIQYKNEIFQSRSLEISGLGNVLISTIELQDRLLTDSGDEYKDSTAQLIDEKIFYFVELKQLQMPEEALCKIICKDLEQ